MSTEDEKVIEHGRELPRPTWRSVRVLLAGVIAAGGIAAIAIFPKGAGPRSASGTQDDPGPTPSSSVASPSPSPTPRSIGERLLGRGPFAVYTVGDADGEIWSVDLGMPGSTPIRLGRPTGQSIYLSTGAQTWGIATPVLTLEYPPEGDTSPPKARIWMLRRGSGFDDRPAIVRADLPLSISSPDSRRLLVMLNRENDPRHLYPTIVNADGSRPVGLRRVVRGGGVREEGELTPLVWLPRGGWLAIPICACDGAIATSWYQISRTGRVSRVTWLGHPTDISPGVSSDGRFISFVDEPFKTCHATNGADVCPDGPVRISIVDTTTHRVRELARYENDLRFGSTIMSPDASRVAFRVGIANKVHVLDARSGKVVAVVTHGTLDLDPLAFIDGNTLLIKGTDTRHPERPGVLLVAHLNGSRTTLTSVSSGISNFLGWIR